MNDDVKMVLGGMGGLILIYLLVKNGSGFASVVSSTGGQAVNITKALQGR